MIIFFCVNLWSSSLNSFIVCSLPMHWCIIVNTFVISGYYCFFDTSNKFFIHHWGSRIAFFLIRLVYQNCLLLFSIQRFYTYTVLSSTGVLIYFLERFKRLDNSFIVKLSPFKKLLQNSGMFLTARRNQNFLWIENKS